MEFINFLFELGFIEIMIILGSAIIGVSWGIMGGATPGISPSISMALMLPITYGMDPAVSVILLASTYLGAEYGGSIPAILINTPGTNAAAATVIDGYKMNELGFGSKALGISLYSAIVGGIVGVFVLIFFTEPLSRLALNFTPMSYFGLGILGISVIVSLSSGSIFKGICSGLMGLLLATIGSDPVTGVQRFTFNSPDLLEGIKPIIVMVGLFAMSEILIQSMQNTQIKPISFSKVVLPNFKEKIQLAKSQLIGSIVGIVEGIIPGAGGSIASFLSYNEAKRWSSSPETFGLGSPEGIAAPETSNNTVASTAIIPVLSFGIPGSNSAAILLGGLLIHGISPGPLLFAENSSIVFNLYTGMLAAVFMLYFIGKLILPLCLWFVSKPRNILIVFIYLTVFTGIYTINNSLIDLWLVLFIGIFGVMMRLLKFPVLPLILGLVLGYMIESNYRRSIVLSGGDISIFFDDTICLIFLLLAAIFILISTYHELRRSC